MAVIDNSTILTQNSNKGNLEFAPAWWANGGHAQTILGHFLRSKSPKIASKEEVLDLADGDQLSVFIHSGKSNTVVYAFHGLGGSVDAGYMSITARAAAELGHSVILMNHRGQGAGANLRHSLPYHSGRSEDLSSTIAWGRTRFPKHKHIAVGFSLSGNALLLLAAKYRAQILPDAAISFNAPISLGNTATLLSQGLNRIYDKRFLQEARTGARAKFRNGWIADLKPLLRAKTLREFDEVYTAPYGGFKNADDYYQTCSAMFYLSKIEIPTLAITAADDPFVDVQHYQQATASKLTNILILPSGGHMGYVAKGSGAWLHQAIRHSLLHLIAQI